MRKRTFRKLLANESLFYYLRITLLIDFVKKNFDSILYLLLTDLILMVNSFYIVLFMFISNPVLFLFFLAMAYLVGEVSF